jgi:hypothetical protein
MQIFRVLSEIKNAQLLKAVSREAQSFSITPAAQRAIENDDGQSILGTEEFDFDVPLINTKVYRRTLLAAQSALRGEGKEKAHQSGVAGDSDSDTNSTNIYDAEDESFITAPSRFSFAFKAGSIKLKRLIKPTRNALHGNEVASPAFMTNGSAVIPTFHDIVGSDERLTDLADFAERQNVIQKPRMTEMQMQMDTHDLATGATDGVTDDGVSQHQQGPSVNPAVIIRDVEQLHEAQLKH